MSTTTATTLYPRELILASAGAGKTFTISSRIIGLLAEGAPAESILASTFTRKAAAEILGRVLTRLAEAGLDEEKARELAVHIRLPEGEPIELDPMRALEILGELVDALHRLNILTLDAFFMRGAKVFSAELGLPPGWSIIDEARAAELRSEALQEVLRTGERAELVELVRLLNRGARPRSVHDQLLSKVEALHALTYEFDPEVEDPWKVGRALGLGPEDGELVQALGVERLAREIEELPVPKTKGGTPNKRWESTLGAVAEAVRAGDWSAFIANTLTQRVLEGALEYSRVEIDQETSDLFLEIVEVARTEIGVEIAAQAKAMGRLTDLYRRAIGIVQTEAAGYRFADITRLIGGGEPLTRRPDLYYRLDSRLRHLLLDEFQDTSIEQWTALEPLTDRILTEGRTGAACIVADPKQSIYGWRGATPDLVYDVGERYELGQETLARSWRSSQVVLDFVNEIFRSIETNPVIPIEDRETVTEWMRAFAPHQAARDLPGHVRIHVGPRDPGRSDHRPLLLAEAAEIVADLHQRAAGRTIGVLTRTNRAVARLIFELRRRGIAASEEGGNPLTDSAPVVALLALLRLADHPDDTIARYHIARSPLSDLVGYDDPTDTPGARRLALKIRRRLVDEGYGKTMSEFVTRLVPLSDQRQARRLDQLVELAYQYDAEATLRPTDFVRFVESERVEDPATASVRVMTIHQSKGLEFDIVVLPELDTPIIGSQTPVALPFREGGSGPISRVYPYLSRELRTLFPEIEEAYQQWRGPVIRDALSSLYVGLTRAKHALHIVVRADGKSGPGRAVSPARIVREAVAPGAPADEGGPDLFSSGDPDWHERLSPPQTRSPDPEPEDDPLPGTAPRPRLGPKVLRPVEGRRGRILARRTPSELEGGSLIDLRNFLRLDTGKSRLLGTLIHAWCQEIRWLEDGIPTDAELRTIAERTAPRLLTGEADEEDDGLQTLLTEFKGWLDQPEIRRALSRESYPDDAVLETETPFAYRRGDTIVEGIIDRLVVWQSAGGGAEIIDYKTDTVSPDDGQIFEERIEFYRPQLEAYADAITSIYGLEDERVEASLLFMRAGVRVPMRGTG